MPWCCCHLIALWFGFQLPNYSFAFTFGTEAVIKWWKKWWSETCCPVCFIPFSCCWGLWAAADAVSGSPSMFSLSFPGSFEFWRSFEYRGCRASSAWQGESVLYFRQLVPKQAHILYSALPSQFLLECWSCCSRYWVTHWISSQIFKQKGLSLGKQTAHSRVSHHLLGLWATVWSQPQKRWFNRWSFPSCGWDFPQVVHVLCSRLMVSWFGMVTWVTLALEELWEDLLSLCVSFQSSSFTQSYSMLHVFIKPGEIWAI